MPGLIACWTKLTVPQTVTIDDASSPDGKKWRLTSNISKSSWQGYQGQCYGRIIESPETVFHITEWDTIASLEGYENSTDRALQCKAQAEFSSTPLESHRCEVDISFWSNMSPHLGLVDAFFPSSISNEDQETIGQTKGLRYLARFSESTPFRIRPLHGWLLERQQYEGQDAVVLRFWNFWRDKDRELHHRVHEGEVTQEQQNRQNAYCKIHSNFLKRLENSGALGIREFHLSGETLWDCYTVSSEGSDDDSDDILIT